MKHLTSSLRRALAPVLASVALTSLSASALAQSIEISFEDPVPATPTLEDQPIQNNFQVYIDYSLPAAHYQDLQIEFPLPNRADYPWTAYVTQSAPGTFTFSQTTAPGGLSQTLRWSTASLSDNQAVSGRITVTLRFPASFAHGGTVYRTLSGTPFPFTVSLSGQTASNAGGPFTPMAANHAATRVATGAPILNWQYTGATFYGFYSATMDGVPGVVHRYDYRMFVCGNAGILGADFGDPSTGGMEWTISRPAGTQARFFRVWSGDNGGIWPSSWDGLSTPASPNFTVLTPNIEDVDTIVARMDEPLTVNSNGVCAYSRNLFVDVFHPCIAGEPVIFPSMTVTAGPAYQPLWSGVGSPPVPSAALTLPDGQVNAINRGECGAFPSFIKYWNGQSGRGSDVNWNISFGAPLGAQSVEDALVVDLLPPGAENPRANLGAYLVDWNAYHCAAMGPTFFDVGALLGALGDGRCVASAISGVNRNPPSPTHPIHGPWTHLAFHAPVWGASEDVEGALRNLSIGVTTFVPEDYDSATHGSEHHNRAQLQGVFEGQPFGNTLVDGDPFEGLATREIIDWACGGISTAVGLLPPIPSLAPGECSFFRTRIQRSSAFEPLRNPVVAITPPAGVTVQSVGLLGGEPAPTDGVWVHGTCIEPVDAFVDPTPGDNPLIFQMGTSDATCTYNTQTLTNQVLEPRVEFCLDEDYPWIDGQQLVFTAEYLGAANEGVYGQCLSTSGNPLVTQSSSHTFTATVPPEMRLTVNPVCLEGEGPAFVVQGSNTGGQDLTEVELRFRTPDAATFAGVTDIVAPPGAVIEVSGQDPPATWGPVGSASPVRWVRLIDPNPTGLGIAAQFGAPLAFTVLLQSALEDGAQLDASGLMRAEQLGDASAEAQPFLIGSCRYLHVTKFYDADEDGLQGGPEEPGLPGWSFEVIADNGAVIGSGQTGQDGGDLSFYLPAGIYIVQEVLPSSDGLDWHPTTPAAEPSIAQEVVIGVGGGDITLSFGNACSCESPDPCLVAACVLDSGGGEAPSFSCVHEPLCAPGNECEVVTCEDGLCISDAAGLCAPWVTYYLPVRDQATGAMSAIRCQLSTTGEAPSCDTQADGTLILYPEHAGACGP